MTSTLEDAQLISVLVGKGIPISNPERSIRTVIVDRLTPGDDNDMCRLTRVLNRSLVPVFGKPISIVISRISSRPITQIQLIGIGDRFTQIICGSRVCRQSSDTRCKLSIRRSQRHDSLIRPLC